MIAAFTAVASTDHIYRDERITPSSLILPPAVLCHLGHSLAAMASGPVGIAVPMFRDGRVIAEVVLASHAVEASDLLRRGRIRGVSIVVRSCMWTFLQPQIELLRGTVTAVDLADRRHADPGALIERVTYVNGMTDAQRRCRAALDAYLADCANPQQIDFEAALEARGVAVFDPLVSVVEPLQGDLTPVRRAEDRRQLRKMIGARSVPA